MSCHDDRYLKTDISLVHEYMKERNSEILDEYDLSDSFPEGSLIRTNHYYSLLSFEIRFPENSNAKCRGMGGGDLEEYIVWLENKLKEKNKKKRI